MVECVGCPMALGAMAEDKRKIIECLDCLLTTLPGSFLVIMVSIYCHKTMAYERKVLDRNIYVSVKSKRV